MQNQSIQRELISLIRFSRHGARVLARRGHGEVVAQYRTACRRRIAELRAVRADSAPSAATEG